MCAKESNPGHLVLLRRLSIPSLCSDSGRQILKGTYSCSYPALAIASSLEVHFTATEESRARSQLHFSG